MNNSDYLMESVYEILHEFNEEYKPLPKGKMTKQQLKHAWRGLKSSLKGHGSARGTTEANIELAKSKKHYKRAKRIGLEKQRYSELGKSVHRSSGELKNLKNRLKGLREEYNLRIIDKLMEDLLYEGYEYEYIIELLNEVKGLGGRVDPFTGIYTGKTGYGSYKNIKKHKGDNSYASFPPVAKASSKWFKLNADAEKGDKKAKKRANKIGRYLHGLDSNQAGHYATNILPSSY